MQYIPCAGIIFYLFSLVCLFLDLSKFGKSVSLYSDSASFVLAGPASWGSFYPKWSRCGNGKRQSPINIMPEDLLYDPNLKHISLSKHKVGTYNSPITLIG